MHQLKLEDILLKALLVACFCWLPCCETQSSNEYQLIPSRDFFNGVPQSDSNVLRLNCRLVAESQDHPDLPFWLNDTQQDIRQLLRLGEEEYTQTSSGLTFEITRELEGNYFCGPNQFNTSPKVPLIGEAWCTQWLQVAKFCLLLLKDLLHTIIATNVSLLHISTCENSGLLCIYVCSLHLQLILFLLR